MKLEQLIENLERGIDRAEEKTWLAFAINADEEAEELLEDLKRIKEELEQFEWERGKGGSFCD
jgi:cell fate (sporulation/competence/biofilm development) regulator YlbF (YheA/YmcA/DUF963 family)